MRLVIAIALVLGLMYLPFVVSVTGEKSGAFAKSLEKHRGPGSAPAQKTSEAEKDEEHHHREIELYRDVIITVTHPFITKILSDYYEQEVFFDALDVKFLDIIRPNGYRTVDYLVKIEVTPLVGAKQSIGIDHITFRVNNGKVALYKFRHIKSTGAPQRSRFAPKEL